MTAVCIVDEVTKAFLQIELHEDDRVAFKLIYRLKMSQRGRLDLEGSLLVVRVHLLFQEASYNII